MSKLLIYVIAGLLIVAIILASPLMMQITGQMLPLDVDYLSKIGGSYGAISAIVSGVALCFIAGSSVLQVRQTQISQLQAVRSMQLELLRMSLENPKYREALGKDIDGQTDESWRLQAYMNLWLMYFQMAFLTGAIEERGLRSWLKTELFNSDRGIEFWKGGRETFGAEASSRRHRAFVRIINEEYSEREKLMRQNADQEKVVRPISPNPEEGATIA